jgi:hypothetical protein
MRHVERCGIPALPMKKQHCQTIGLLAMLALTACEPSSFKQAREAVSHNMRDPESSQFRAVAAGYAGAVCGEVNAKNAMGAYVGFRRFAWSDSLGAYVDDGEGLDGAEFWAKLCTPEGADRERLVAAAAKADSIEQAQRTPEETARYVRKLIDGM